ncbi:MAG TPA: TIGR03936 family radical SAM-associated protein [Actinomycetales bacterium]|nr:TIGR03936 family radical SAM-associated protein [Actinomycetales bacterium]
MPDGPAPAPAVQKLRLRYAKRGRLRFSSHRDFQRALERALRRAAVPMAYSAGFTPHPKVSYANSAPTGTASEAEYVELSVTERCDPEAVREALDRSLPPGLDVLQVVEADAGSLADRLEASEWKIVLPGVTRAAATAALEQLMARDAVEVERLFKNGPRRFDARGAVVHARVEDVDQDDCAILQVVVRHTTPAVRPDDVLAALRVVAQLVPPSPPQVTRLAQGPLSDAGTVTDPLATVDAGGA